MKDHLPSTLEFDCLRSVELRIFAQTTSCSLSSAYHELFRIPTPPSVEGLQTKPHETRHNHFNRDYWLKVRWASTRTGVPALGFSQCRMFMTFHCLLALLHKGTPIGNTVFRAKTTMKMLNSSKTVCLQEEGRGISTSYLVWSLLPALVFSTQEVGMTIPKNLHMLFLKLQSLVIYLSFQKQDYFVHC